MTVVLASAGFLSPASRGALLTSAIVLYLLLALPAGYLAVLLWTNMTRSLEGWTGVCLRTACYFPGARDSLLMHATSRWRACAKVPQCRDARAALRACGLVCRLSFRCV